MPAPAGDPAAPAPTPSTPAPTAPADKTPPVGGTPATEPTDDRSGAKGAPSEDAQLQRLKADLAATKQRETDLQAKLDAAKTVEDVQKAVTEANEAAAEQVKAIAVKAYLLTNGCLNAEAFIAGSKLDLSKVEVSKDGDITAGIDIAKGKTDLPYLFTEATPPTVPTVKTGAAPAGSPAASGTAKTIKEALSALNKK